MGSAILLLELWGKKKNSGSETGVNFNVESGNVEATLDWLGLINVFK